MRSLRSSLVTFALSTLVGAAIFAGCSADGTSGDPLDGLGYNTDSSPTDPEDDDEAEAGSNIIPDDGKDNGGGNGGGGGIGGGTKDAGSKDGGSKDGGSTKDAATADSGSDAGTFPETGDPCVGATTFTRPCGFCGKQTALCISPGVVGPYSQCDAAEDACEPGTVVTEACGNCGTVTKTCSKTCKFTLGSCTGQPLNHCKPDTVQYTDAQCSDARTYSTSSCSSSCQWSPWSNECKVITTPNKMTISGTVGSVVSATWTMEGAGKRPSGTTSVCPASTSLATTGPLVPVEVTNGTNKTATITAFHTKSATGVTFDASMWYYSGSGIPMGDADIKQCVKLGDQCTAKTSGGATGTSATNICGGSGFYSFSSLEDIVIPPGGKIIVFSSGYSASTSIGDRTIVLNLRTDKLE